MSTREEKLESMLAEFDRTQPVLAPNLRSVIERSPELRDRMLDAIDAGGLEKFAVMDGPSVSTLGQYDFENKAIVLPPNGLAAVDDDPRRANRMLFTLGHEVEHAVQHEDIVADQQRFENTVHDIANGPPPRDYTQAIQTHMQENRDREARDEIAGFNVLAAQIERENPGASREELFEKLYESNPDDMSRYFDVKGFEPNQTYAPKEGIGFHDGWLRDEFNIPPTQENVEAFSRYFFDSNPVYTDLAARDATNLAAAVELNAQQSAMRADPSLAPPAASIDLNALGLSDVMALPPGLNGVRQTPLAQQDLPQEIRPQQPMPQPHSQPELDGRLERRAETDSPHLNNLIDNMHLPEARREALTRLAASPDGDHFREEGKTQYRQLMEVPSPDVAPPSVPSPVLPDAQEQRPRVLTA